MIDLFGKSSTAKNGENAKFIDIIDKKKVMQRKAKTKKAKFSSGFIENKKNEEFFY